MILSNSIWSSTSTSMNVLGLERLIPALAITRSHLAIPRCLSCEITYEFSLPPLAVLRPAFIPKRSWNPEGERSRDWGGGGRGAPPVIRVRGERTLLASSFSPTSSFTTITSPSRLGMLEGLRTAAMTLHPCCRYALTSSNPTLSPFLQSRIPYFSTNRKMAHPLLAPVIRTVGDMLDIPSLVGEHDISTWYFSFSGIRGRPGRPVVGHGEKETKELAKDNNRHLIRADTLLYRSPFSYITSLHCSLGYSYRLLLGSFVSGDGPLPIHLIARPSICQLILKQLRQQVDSPINHQSRVVVLFGLINDLQHPG